MHALRFLPLAAVHTVHHGTAAIIAGRRRAADVPGGPFDRAALGWSSAMLAAGRITVSLEGAHHCRGPVVYVANHVSMIDIWALITTLPPVPKFVFKKELLRVPFFGPAAYHAGHIMIDRQNRGAAFQAYDRAAEVIRRGASAVVFAEGTRSRHGRLLPFKKGPFVLAIAAQVPVVPVYIAGSYELMPRRALWPRPGHVTLTAGSPIPTAGLGYDDRERLCAQTREALLALGARAGTD